MRHAANKWGKYYTLEGGSCEVMGWLSVAAVGELDARQIMEAVEQACDRKNSPVYDKDLGYFQNKADAEQAYEFQRTLLYYREYLGQRGARYTHVEYLRLTEVTLDEEGDEYDYETVTIAVAMPKKTR